MELNKEDFTDNEYFEIEKLSLPKKVVEELRRISSKYRISFTHTIRLALISYYESKPIGEPK